MDTVCAQSCLRNPMDWAYLNHKKWLISLQKSPSADRTI